MRGILHFQKWLVFLIYSSLPSDTFSQNDFIFKGDFELPGSCGVNCNYWGNDLNSSNYCNCIAINELGNVSVVNNVVNQGTYAAKCWVINIPDKNKKYNFGRAELKDNYKIEFSNNNEFRYSFALYLPKDYVGGDSTEPYKTFEGSVIHAQLWPVPDNKKEDLLKRYPVLTIGTEKGKWSIINRWSSKKLQNKEEGDYSNVPINQRKKIVLSKIEADKGKWTQWIIHVKWSSFNDGFLKIYKNDTLVYESINHPNCYNDDFLPVFKAGIYCYFSKDVTSFVEKSEWNDEKFTYFTHYGYKIEVYVDNYYRQKIN